MVEQSKPPAETTEVKKEEVASVTSKFDEASTKTAATALTIRPAVTAEEEKKETPAVDKKEEATMQREFEQIMSDMKKLSRNDSKFNQDH